MAHTTIDRHGSDRSILRRRCSDGQVLAGFSCRASACGGGIQWGGKLIIGTVDFRWTGPAYLHGIELRDTSGRTRLRAESVTLTMRDWPGLHPVLSDVDVEGLSVKGYFADGALELPTQPVPPQPAKNASIGLHSVTVRNMSIAVAIDGNDISAWDGLDLQINPDGKTFRIDLKRVIDEPGEELLASGTLAGESLETDLDIAMRHTVAAKEGTAIFKALHVPYVTAANGKVDLKMKLRGQLTAVSSSSTPGFPAPSP